jgi:hypothetical protein
MQLLLVGLLVSVMALLAWKLGHGTDTSAQRRAVMAQVLDTVESKAVGFSADGWSAIRGKADDAASKADDTLSLYAAIKQVLAGLDDNGHSFALNPGQWQRIRASTTEDAVELQRKGGERVRLLSQPGASAKILLVEVPAHAAMDDRVGLQFSTGLAREISLSATAKPCAVIVDLRKTGGGNMWPAIAGLRAVIDPQHLGSIVDRNGRPIASYRALADRALSADIGSDALPVGALAQRPLAILVGSGTSSASEAIAAFLRVRPKSVLVGQATAGFTTTNEKFDLPDGGALILATARLTDPSGNAHRGPLRPDIAADHHDEAAALHRAAEWAAESPQCRGAASAQGSTVVVVRIDLPGLAPDRIEREVAMPLEDAVERLSDVVAVRTRSDDARFVMEVRFGGPASEPQRQAIAQILRRSDVTALGGSELSVTLESGPVL